MLPCSASQNRINRLVIEEERAAKRIAETRRRAKEIWELKRQNAANQVSQQEASEWMTAEQNLQRELLLQTRTERTRSIDASRSAVHQMRKEEVRLLCSHASLCGLQVWLIFQCALAFR